MMDKTVLASLLEPLEDSEGILVCTNEVPYRDDESTKRLFGTFQFTEIDGLDGGPHYRYTNSGVVICHTGPSINVLIGGEVPEAIPDLMRALDQLGWKDVDIYSRHGQAFFDDIARHTPASVDLNITLREVPIDLSDDLADFARQATAASAESFENAEASFMQMLRSDAGLPPSPVSTPQEAPAADVEASNLGMGVAVGVAHNYVPDSDADEFAPMVPAPIPLIGEPPVNALPISAAPKPAQARPVISLATPSPVDLQPVPQNRPPAAVEPVLAQDLHRTSGASRLVGGTTSTNSISVKQVTEVQEETPVQKRATPSPTPMPAAQVRHKFESHPVSSDFPAEPISLGDSLVVACLPEHRYLDEELQELADGRDIVILEPGAATWSDCHASWTLLDEHSGVDLVAALWPNEKQDHLAIHAMFTLAQHQSAPHSLSNLLALAGQDISDELFSQFADAGIHAQLIDHLRMQHRMGLLDMSLWRMVVDLWSAAAMTCSRQVLFSALAERQVKPLLVLVRLDAMDFGSAAEFLAAGALRWASRLANSQRTAATVVPAAPLMEKEALAASLVSQMPPDMLSLFKRIINS